MTDAGFAFHRNGNITYTDPRDGEVYTLYAPRVGAMREIEEYGTELADQLGVGAMQERLREITESLMKANKAVEEAEASGDAEWIAEAKAAQAALQSDITDENEQTARDLVTKTKEQSLKWFVRAIQLCGSDNWPKLVDKATGQPHKDEEGRDRIDVDALPAAVRNQQLVTRIKGHWWDVPLAESPSNGAAPKATVTDLLNQ